MEKKVAAYCYVGVTSVQQVTIKIFSEDLDILLSQPLKTPLESPVILLVSSRLTRSCSSKRVLPLTANRLLEIGRIENC